MRKPLLQASVARWRLLHKSGQLSKVKQMIVELVEFRHPPQSARGDIVAAALATVPRWRADPALGRKHYLLGVDGQGGAGVYFWSSIEAAQRAHDADWVAATEARTGQPVRIRYFDLLMTLDNEDGSLKDGHGVPLAV